MKQVIIGFVVIFLLAAAAVGGASAWILSWYSASGPLTKEIVLQIESGTGFNAITQLLLDNQVIDNDLPFKAMAVWTKDRSRVKAGEYRFTPAMSPQKVMSVLVKGESITHAITIPEGLTAKEVVIRLMTDMRLKGAVPIKISEGSLMPDTYHFHRGDSRASIVVRMQKAMAQTLQELWGKRAEGLPVKTAQEALVLASMVEKETGVGGERGRVAAVFVNRLRKDMLLQSDPTVVYGIELEDGPMGRPLWLKDLKVDHPYNTYLYKGLPPRPIANPGRAAIEAVMNPPQTDEYYFVATGVGGHHFAKTLREHNHNVVKYRQELRRQQSVR